MGRELHGLADELPESMVDGLAALLGHRQRAVDPGKPWFRTPRSQCEEPKAELHGAARNTDRYGSIEPFRPRLTVHLAARQSKRSEADPRLGRTL